MKSIGAGRLAGQLFRGILKDLNSKAVPDQLARDEASRRAS
jgi:hypothetical protein